MKNFNFSKIFLAVACLVSWSRCETSGSRLGKSSESVGETVAHKNENVQFSMEGRIDSAYQWYVANAISLWPRTSFNEEGPWLEGKQEFLDVLAGSGYFSNWFLDSLSNAFNECEKDGKGSPDLDHLGCEEADVLCFNFISELNEIEYRQILLDNDLATVHLNVVGKRMGPSGISTPASSPMRLRMVLEANQWMIQSSTYEVE